MIGLTQLQAERIIEALRQGIPPDGYVANFTVGRKNEIDRLDKILSSTEAKALLIKANYGAGKTHTLRLIRELALKKFYAVSLITLDASSNIRFNRMDQILGETCRQLEIPTCNKKSIRYLFDLVSKTISNSKPSDKNYEEIINLTNNFKWDHSSYLSSGAYFVALRAWFFADENLKDFIEDWLFCPWNYKTQRKLIYEYLINNLSCYFRDRRWEWQYYDDGVFVFDNQDYRQSWDALNDINRLAKLAGLKGLVLLVDEFEDVIYNLRNIKYEQKAFWNLFQFFFEKKFDGLSFFGVTPDFVEKCKFRLLKKCVYNYDYGLFDKLETFQMSELIQSQLIELGEKIYPIHFLAYSWSMPENVVKKRIAQLCQESNKIPTGEKVRTTIKNLVKLFDALMEEKYE